MNDTFEHKGMWFLPDQDEEVAGILKFYPGENLVLELIGKLGSEESEHKFDLLGSDKLDVIHGVTSNAKEVTLINCTRGKSQRNFSCPFPVVNYDCQYALIGHHLAGIQEKRYNSIEVRVPYLSTWVSPGTLRHTIYEEPETHIQHHEYGFSDNQKEKNKCEVQLDDSFTLSLLSGLSLKEEHYLLGVEIKQYSYFEIRSVKEKYSIAEFLSKIGLFNQFISFACLSPISILSISLIDEDDFQDAGRGKKYYHRGNLFFVNRENSPSPSIEPYKYLFSYHQIESRFPDIIQRWFALNKEVAPIRWHLIKSISTRHIYDSGDFLLLVQALEGYHSRFIDQKKNFLISRLQYLLELYSDIPLIAKLNLDIDAVKDSRNYYSHFYYNRPNSKVLDGRELFYLTQKLRVLLICCLLTFIGFTNDEINTFLRECNNSLITSCRR
ncbi:MAG: hypothetical protein LIP06_06655 [Tannerellaceae bacterium]|nr:hypothetical protein [Tannerellaceae bacterium]